MLADDTGTECAASQLRSANVSNDEQEQDTAEQLLKRTSSLTATTLSEEIWLCTKIIVPLMFANVTEIIPQMMALQIAGHLPKNSAAKMSVVSMTRSFSNVFGLAISWGLTSGLYTLVPQSIGARAFDKLAVSVQRAFLVALTAMIPLAVVQWNIGAIMQAIGQPPELCQMIAIYSRLYIPNMFAITCLTIMQRVAQGFDYNVAQLVIGIAVNCVMYPLCYALVYYTPLDYLGCDIALDIVMFLNFFLLAAFLCFKGHSYLFKPHSWSTVVQGLVEYWYLSYPGVFSASAMWVSAEVLIIVAGYMRKPEVSIAVMGVMNTVFNFVLFLIFAYAIAIQTRVGKYIGCGMVNSAQKSAIVGCGLQTVHSVVFAVILLTFRKELANFFSNDAAVVRISAQTLYVLAAQSLALGLAQTVLSVYKGLGYPKECSILIIASYYCVSIPLTFVLLFAFEMRRTAVIGCFVTLGCMLLAQALSGILMTCYLLAFIDWHKAAAQAFERSCETILRKPKKPVYGSFDYDSDSLPN